MSTVTKAMSSVEFHVNARQANAALQSMQEEAKKCRVEVEDLQKQAAKGVTTVKVGDEQMDIEKRIRQVKSLQKTWESAAQSQLKGAKAFDELWKNARMGTIETMNAAQIKAGINGSKPVFDRLRLGDAEDRMKAQAIKDMQDQGQKVLNQLKTTTDQIIKQIADGETIAADVLEREARNLKSIMDLLPPLSQEWKDYNLQYQAINQQIERQTVLERQLRGEIVTREDAIRVVNAANREATQQEIAQEEQRAKTAREAAEAKAAEADQYRTTVEQKQSEIFATNDLIAAKRREIDAHHESAAAAKDAADKARDAAYKDRKQAEQEARDQQDAYNKQKKIRDDAAKDVEKFRKELEKLGEVKAEPKIDTSEIDAKLEELRGSLSRVQQMKSTAQEKIASAKEVLGDTGKPWNNERVKKAREEDRVTQEENIAKLNAKWDEYWEKQERNAREFAATLNKIAVDDVDWDEFYTHVTGPNAELAKSWYRVEQRNLRGVDYWGEDSDNYKELVSLRASKKLGSASDGMLEELKLLEALKRKWDEYQKALNKAREESPKYDAAYNELGKARVEIIQQERLLETYTEHERQLKEQIAETEKLSQAQQQSTTATAAQTEAIKQQEHELESLKKDAETAASAIQQLEERLKQLRTADRQPAPTAESAIGYTVGYGGKGGGSAAVQGALQDKLSDAWLNEDETTIRAFMRAGKFSGIYDRDSRERYASVSKKEILERYTEYLSNLWGGYATSDDDMYNFVSGGKLHDTDELESITEKERQKFLEMSWSKQVAWVERVVKKQWGEIDAILYSGADDNVAYVGKDDSSMAGLRTVMNAERWKKGAGEDGHTQAELDATEKLIEETNELIQSDDELLKTERLLETTKKAKLEIDEKLAAAQQQSTTATAASNEQDEKRAGVQQKLTDAETRLAEENRKLNEQADKTITANQQAAQAANDHQQSVKALGDVMEENRKTGQRLGEEMGLLTKQHKQQTEELADASEKMTDAEKESNRHIKTEQEARLRIQQLNNQSIEQLTASLRVLEEDNRRINDPGNQRWQENERYIGQLTLRLEELKKQSAELRREPVLDMMTQRMDQLGTLSRDALTETKKFWQAMYDGADNDAAKLREIEDNLKRINTEEQKRDRKTLEERAARLQQVDNYSVGELREGIDAAKRLQDQYHLTDDELQQLSVNIVAAETRIAKVGVEAERQAQKQHEQIELMEQQLSNGSALTESALKAQVNYWQRLADDPKAAAEAVKRYTANMERAQSLLDVKERVDIRMKAGRLDNMDGYSVSELREGIDAAQKMQDTFRLSNDEVQQLSEKIVAAEVRISQFSVESERQAQRQREQIALMEQQLANGSALTESALKAQVNYWQRLADDPKAAAESVAQYTANMKQAQDLLDQSQRADIESKAGRLQNLGAYSISEIREGIDAAKKMQDTFHLTNAEVQKLSEDIVDAEKHVSQFSVESERQAQRQREQIALMEQQLANGSALTESALKAQVNYWQRLADDPKATNEEIERYLKNMREAQHLQSDIAANRGADTLAKAQSGGFATANMTDLTQAIKDIKEYQALIKDPNGAGKETFGAAKEQIEALTAQLDALKGKTDKVKATFEDADAVMKRFAEHMKGVVVTTPGQSIDEQLSQHVSVYDDDIKRAAENVDYYEQQIKEATDELERMEKELAELEKKHANSSWFRKRTEEYEDEAWRIEDLRDAINGHDVAMDDGTTFRTGKKQDIEDLKNFKQNHQNYLDFYKQKKAEALGLVEVEEQVQKANRMTREEMQEGIKVLEAEAMAQDRSTADGQKRWEELRKTIGEMNRELKEATGEWMKLADAERVAQDAGTDRFAGYSAQDIQRATQALERQRDTIIATIREKRANKEATKAEEDQLADLTKKLRSLKFEQDNVNMSQEKMRTLIETPANAVNLDELRAAIKRADGQLRQMQDSLGENSSEYKRFAEQVRNAKNVMKEMEGQAKASATAWEKAFNRLKTYVVMYMGFNEVWQKVSNTARDLMDLSDRMGEVRKTTGFTADEVGRLSENLKKMDVRTSLTSLMEISTSAGQLGLKTLEDVQGFTEAANKLMIALPEMGREAATEMMRVAIATGEVDKIRKQLQEGTIEGSSATAVAMEKIASTIDRLRASSASTAPEITDFVKRVGAVGAQSGITIDQVAALGSTVSSLGMRIEMSATALSRMIPAIRNNAFELAKAIGVTPDTIRNLFDTGRGMEVILMILQRIKDTGMDADSVEQMLGMAGMRDIMKDLNQQGARAGIVFSGLSQNVDELRRQLGVAGEAYEENIAIQQEFDKMNETTAAKWERLKNAFEEGFVGDKPQRLLGGIIDGLRKIVDFMVGDSSISSAFRTILVYLGLVKMQLISLAAGALTSVGGGLRNIGIMLGFIKGEMTKLQWGNIFTALAGAVLYAYTAFKDLKSAAEKAQEALGKTKDDVARAQEQFEGYWMKLKDTSTALEQARKSHDQLSAEVDKLRNSTDKGAAATENLRKKEDELKKSEDNVTKASNDHKTAISQMNSIYGKYLGFILTETNYANLAAAAHNKVAAAIEREMLMKQKQAAISEVDSNYSADIASNYGKLSERLTQQGLNRSQASQAMADLQKFLHENVSYDAVNNQTVVSKAVTDQLKRSGLNLSKATSNEIVALWYDKYLKDTYHLSDKARMNITGVHRTADMDEGWQNAYSPFATNVRGGYADTYLRRERERGSVSAVYNADITRAEGEETKAAGTLLQKLEKEANDAKTKILAKATSDKDRNDAYINLANALEGLDNRINELDPKKDAETINRLRDMAKTLSAEGISVKKLAAARREIHSTLFDRATFDENAIREAGNAHPFGTSEPGESTNWKEMTAEQLVNRRKQMNEFVNSLQTDTDVKAVLAEDKALMKAFKGRQATMREVVEWYNTERLKIQDELHARHLTNTGDWLDPKKQRSARKQWHDEIDAYLHELDAYYTERKTRIEEARNDEEITEGEAWRRTIQNDNEWQTRRAELQKIYADKSGEVTKEEMDAIYRIISERTGDTVEFVRGTVARTNKFAKDIAKDSEKGAAMAHKWWSSMDLNAERSFLKAAQAIGKQMKFIEETLAKERPYDGITKNLQDNLDKMGVLAAKYRRENEELARQNKEPKYSNEQITAQSYDEMAFYLRQAADAYSIDIDKLLRRMVKEGMTATAEEISKSDMLKQAVMGQLRKTYQEVQDAIKKEASQIKKDVEIIWNDDARGIGGMSMKATFDKALAQLGMQQDSVSRANSLIGAGAASDNVASRLAMKQIEVQMRMQKAQYDMYRTQANQRMAALKAEAKEHQRIAELEKQAGHEAAAAEQRTKAMVALRDAENVRLSLGLTLAEETKKEEQQKAELLKIQEESQNRLYTSLREWADLLTSSLQGVMEASHAGDAEYYNERAKLNLTGKGGPGAGTYIIIDNEGTSDAEAHYEYLDEREALERQREIERQNAMAEAWRKLMDDINMKMSEQITDWMNAYLQNQSIDANTQAVIANTEALWAQLRQGASTDFTDASQLKRDENGFALDGSGQMIAPIQPTEPAPTEQPMSYWPLTEGEVETIKSNISDITQHQTDVTIAGQQAVNDALAEMPNVVKPAGQMTEEEMEASIAKEDQMAKAKMTADDKVTENKKKNDAERAKSEKQADQQIANSSQSTFAKMTQAANLYGIAYQTMSNDNLSASQKFQMFALQAAGQAAIGMLTTNLFQEQADQMVRMPGILGKLLGEMPYPAAVATYAAVTALMGGLMGLAVSQVSKSKSQIAQVTGASVGAGRLATGMLTYAEGNVNELTDPASLTPGRQYNVDGADGKTYRARYMGKGAKTHITNGPEFHLVGEAGREAIIDAKTTRLLQMDETGIWHAIQTLYNGGSISGLSSRRRRGGVAAFADGNIGEFEDAIGGETPSTVAGGFSMEQMAAFQQSLDNNTAIMQRMLTEGIEAFVSPYGKRGIVNGYDTYKKEAQRHGEKYL